MNGAARAKALVLALCVAACHADRITTEDAPPITFAPHAWSGGILVLHSLALQGAAELPTVMAGADTLAARRFFGSDSVQVQLPDTNGPIALFVRQGGGETRSVGSVRVHGFLRAGPGPSVDGSIYPWPGGANPTALAFQDGRLVKLDLRSNSAAILLPDTGLGRGQCLRSGPRPSAASPGLIVISQTRGECGPLIAVPLVAGIAAPDTGPPPFRWPAAHLGRGRWLLNSKYDFSIVTGSPSMGWVSGPPIPGSQPSGFAVSPRGDRVVPTGCSGYSDGVPVFDAAGPGLAYYLPQTTGGAAFSEQGDTLFVATTSATGYSALLAVDATSGTVLARAPLHVDLAGVAGVAVDPRGPWVYVAGARGLPIVEVFDRASLAPVATLRAPTALPGFDPYTAQYSDYVIVQSPVERRLFVALNGGAPTLYVLQFELMP